MRLHLFREVKNFGRGDPADGSDSWTSKVCFYLVPEKDLEEFHEANIGEFESQDYSYNYSCKEVCAFESVDLPLIWLAVNNQFKKEVKKSIEGDAR